MYYGNGDNNLEDYILSDLKEMELADIPVNINVIALIDRPSSPLSKFGSWPDTRLFRVVHSEKTDELSSEELSSDELSLTVENAEELNMCDASNIAKFISFCKSRYRSDRYVLIIGSHGDGWLPPSLSVLKSIGYDSTPHYSATGILNLAAALKDNPVDVVVFDACSMGNIETLYMLEGCAEYIVASPNTLPMEGFDYTDLFSSIGTDVKAVELSMAFSSSWQRVHDDITMMVYSMQGLTDFISSGYIGEISAATISDTSGALAARNGSIVYQVNGLSDHIDIVDYCRRFMPERPFPFSSFIITENEPVLSFYFPSSDDYIYPGYKYTPFAEVTFWDEAIEAVSGL